MYNKKRLAVLIVLGVLTMVGLGAPVMPNYAYVYMDIKIDSTGIASGQVQSYYVNGTALPVGGIEISFEEEVEQGYTTPEGYFHLQASPVADLHLLVNNKRCSANLPYDAAVFCIIPLD